MWGPIPLATATVVLAILGLLDGDDRPWFWILLVAAFIVVHSARLYFSEQSIVSRFAQNYDRAQHYATQMVSDLAALSGNHFDLWVVDIYVPRVRFRPFQRHFAFLDKTLLVRQLSVSLVEVSTQPAHIDLERSQDVETRVYAECFTSVTPQVWFDEDRLGSEYELASSVHNGWHSCTDQEKIDMGKAFGIMTVWPIVDQLSSSPRGILVVYVKPEHDKPLRARGALLSIQGRRHIHNACIGVYDLLGRH